MDSQEEPLKEPNLLEGQLIHICWYNIYKSTLLVGIPWERPIDPLNALYRHDRDIHNGEVQKYKANTLSREQTLLLLSIKEVLYIEQQAVCTSMIGRNESGRGALVFIMDIRVNLIKTSYIQI